MIRRENLIDIGGCLLFLLSFKFLIPVFLSSTRSSSFKSRLCFVSKKHLRQVPAVVPDDKSEQMSFSGSNEATLLNNDHPSSRVELSVVRCEERNRLTASSRLLSARKMSDLHTIGCSAYKSFAEYSPPIINSSANQNGLRQKCFDSVRPT